MIKIAVIVSDDEFSFMAGSILAKAAHPGIEYEIINAYGTNVDAIELKKPDIILARGLTGGAIRKRYPHIAVLEMPTSAQDILNAVGICKKLHSARKVLILGTGSMALDTDMLRDIVNVEMRLRNIENETEITDALKNARQEGFDAIVGGFTACRIAQEQGWDCAYIRTSNETFSLAVNEAVKTAIVMYTERAKAEIYRSLLDSTNEAVLYFDESGHLAMSNRKAQSMLSLPADTTDAATLTKSLFPDHDADALLSSGREQQGVLCNINNIMLVAAIVPVMVDGQRIGTLCTFQPAKEIQAAETLIRKAINKKGLTAKYHFSDIVHASPAMTDALSTAEKYAKVEANVLLVGETGTGKELFAQSIHNASNRGQRPFVAINCAAFPDTLLDSELFGYADGAFSGAVRGGKTGLFELAHGGTMLLDEVGEIPLNLQPKLLRALQEREIRRIGDDRVVPVDVRIIAATNLDLWERVEAGAFRSDLLHRLDVLSLMIAPLRERTGDIMPIAEHYIHEYCRAHNRPPLTLDPSAWQAMETYSWPGNTRELRNVCERLAIVHDTTAVVSNDAVERVLRAGGSRRALVNPAIQADPHADKPKTIQELVAMADSMRIKRADLASMLGISRATLFRRLKELEIEQFESQ